MVAVLRSFAPRPRLLTLARAAALWAALLAVSVVVPHAPIFVGRNFDIRTANLMGIVARAVCDGRGS